MLLLYMSFWMTCFNCIFLFYEISLFWKLKLCLLVILINTVETLSMLPPIYESKLGMLTISLCLILKAPSKICSRRHTFFLSFFSEKTNLDISCESSAWYFLFFSFFFFFFLYEKKKKKKKNNNENCCSYDWRFEG